jgi:hypothetical protein
MANEKKWYSYFVSVEPDSESSSSSPGSSDAAKAIADIAASIQPPAAQQQRVEQRLQQAAAASAASTPSSATSSKPASAAAPQQPGKQMSFNEIYAAAEIEPPKHGYTILKVSEMLDNPHIKELPAEVKKSSVMVALDAAGVKVQEIVEDAVRRDKALDAFERVQQKQVEDLEAAKLEENRKLQAELDKMAAEYKAKIQANNDAVARGKDSFYAWRVEKQKMEQRISDTVSHFVTENPITTNSSPAPASSTRKTGI